MKSKPTVTIGISAYNEEVNIGQLLMRLTTETPGLVRIEKIFVISDGSTDNTVSVVKKIKSRLVELRSHRIRAGLYTNQNQIIRLSFSDILILLDADILPKPGFIDAICQPMIENPRIGIVGARTIAARPNSWFEQILVSSRQLKDGIYDKLNGGHNLYHCHGRARAFSKKLYRKIVWPKDFPEDSFSYIFCIENGFQFYYAPQAQVIFRAPATLKEYLEKSRRFLAGKNKMLDLFPHHVVKRHYFIPPAILFYHLLFYFYRRPISTALFLCFMVYIRIFHNHYQHKSLWTPASTSKRVL